MPVARAPCTQCKGDGLQPQCGRCRDRGLRCSRPAAKPRFRADARAAFATDQEWVKSEVKGCECNGGRVTTNNLAGLLPLSRSRSLLTAPLQVRHAGESKTSPTQKDLPSLDGAPPLPASRDTQQPGRTGPATVTVAPRDGRLDGPYSVPSTAVSPQLETNVLSSRQRQHQQWASDARWEATRTPPSVESFRQSHEHRHFPLEDIQEACLLRYFVEELSHWFDLCDEHRHFQLVVPVLAREHSHLLNAIFALSSRHLSRKPQYRTGRGIEYQGQLLEHLNRHAAVEYMLRCIPALRAFHDIRDEEMRASIIATAVILRQLEEIDDEEDGQGREAAGEAGPASQVNFLPILDAVLSSLPSQSLFERRSLIQASYWMALRQEIYHSFTRRQPPQMILSPDYWRGASSANKSVMHTLQVAKWLWGSRSDQEWSRLTEQQEHLEQRVLVNFKPILRRGPDKAKGEIFPTIWFGSNIEVTSIQQAVIAKMALVAEKPTTGSQAESRSAWRVIESEVRSLILELCGIALCHPASPPALLHAAMGIQLYGDFFTDPYERHALKGVVERYRDAHAWPVQRLLDMFP